MSTPEAQFHTGQPIWVMEPDGSERPGEFIGEGEQPRPAPATALIIFLDAPSAAVVEVERLRPREGAPPGSDAAVQARAAPRSKDPRREATEQAFSAAGDAKAAEAAAAEALERAAYAYELAASGHDRAAELADQSGHPTAVHRRAARDIREAARRAREAAVDARERLHRPAITPQLAAAPLGQGGQGRSARR